MQKRELGKSGLEASAIGLGGLLLLLLAGHVNAYTSVRVALNSNILVDGERVIFAQGTGSLTVLDLQTGKVLLRKKPEKVASYSGNLQRSAYGVLMTAYEKIVLLDGSTFDPVWQAARCFGAVTDGEYVISHDGDHIVSCRKVQSGQLCWTVDMEGGWHLLAAKGKALVATPDYWHGRPALLVLELESGRELLHYEAPPGVHWRQVYFDGELIYVVDGSVERRGFEQKPGSLSALNLQGKVVTKVDWSSRDVVSSAAERWNGRFIWGDRYFNDKGRVQPVTAQERKAVVEFWKRADSLRDVEPWRREDYVPKLLPYGIFVTLPTKDAVAETSQLLQMIMAKGSWKAYAPHLGQHGVVSDVIEAQDSLLLGSSEGHVECLDIETGRPRWLYVFPVVRQTVTYSVPHGMPPYLTEQAAAYRNEVGKRNETCGSIPLPQGFDPASAKWSDLRNSAEYARPIVFDPSPDDPFSNLRWYFFWLAICTLAPIIGALLPLLGLARRKLARRQAPNEVGFQPSKSEKLATARLVVWSLILSVSPALGLFLFGRVSHSWTLALKVTFALMIVGAICGIVQLSMAKRWGAVALSSAILIGWVYLMFYPWRFA